LEATNSPQPELLPSVVENPMDALDANPAVELWQAIEQAVKGGTVKIVDAATAQAAAARYKKLRDLEKMWKGHHDPVVASAYETHRLACEQRKKGLDPIAKETRAQADEIGRWDMEQERIREEEQRRLEAEARKKEEDAALEAAALLEEDGRAQDALDVIEEAITAPAPVTSAPPKQKYEGASVGRVSDWKLVDMSKVKLEFLQLDTVKINALVRTLGADAEDVVGRGSIQVFKKATVAKR
jgi:hypothetical protein